MNMEEFIYLEETKIELGARLHTLRMAAGIAIEELGSIINISPKTIDSLEIGRGSIDLPALAALASFYDKKIAINIE